MRMRKGFSAFSADNLPTPSAVAAAAESLINCRRVVLFIAWRLRTQVYSCLQHEPDHTSRGCAINRWDDGGFAFAHRCIAWARAERIGNDVDARDPIIRRETSGHRTRDLADIRCRS